MIGARVADLSHLEGPFDVIGDVHGCYHTLCAIMRSLGYRADGGHPRSRTLVFVGDIVDRGPNTGLTLDLVFGLATAGRALVARGNHEVDYARRLAEAGRSGAVLDWLESLPIQILFDRGRLLVVHGAMRADLIGQTGEEAAWYAVYGARTTDPRGGTMVSDWQAEYRGEPFVVAGHTPVAAPRWSEEGGGSVIIDTGAAHAARARDRLTGEPFEGYLTALRWPERTLVFQETAPADLPSVFRRRPRSSGLPHRA